MDKDVELSNWVQKRLDKDATRSQNPFQVGPRYFTTCDLEQESPVCYVLPLRGSNRHIIDD